jgi:toxin FitB
VGFVVLDTHAASQLQKERLPKDLIARHLTGNRLATTFVTQGELEKWAERRSWGARRRDELHAWIRRLDVLPYDQEVARRWGGLAARAELRGRPRPVNDMWIAACCLVAGLPLLTLNKIDFRDFADYEGLVLLS